MKVENAQRPTPDQIKTLLESDVTGPVAMLNLLKFKEKAEYADGRETDLTGQEAYGLYGSQMAPFVMAAGGRLLFSGAVKNLMLGEVGELWDSAAIMEYPSKEDFVKIVSDPQVAEFSVHRTAGLAGQLLIRVSAAALPQ